MNRYVQHRSVAGRLIPMIRFGTPASDPPASRRVEFEAFVRLVGSTPWNALLPENIRDAIKLKGQQLRYSFTTGSACVLSVVIRAESPSKVRPVVEGPVDTSIPPAVQVIQASR